MNGLLINGPILWIWLVEFSAFYVFYGQTIHDHYHLGITQGDAPYAGIVIGQFEGALFQSFVIKCKAYTLPMQQLNLIALPVDENKYIAAAWVVFQVVLYQAR